MQWTGRAPAPTLEDTVLLGGAVDRDIRRPAVAVILAAGRASRLSAHTGGGSKATLKVGGMPLVERSVRTVLDAGVERVVVVLGHDAEAVERCLDMFSPAQVQTVRAPDWTLGNSASFMAAAPFVAGEGLFLVMTADHLFSRGALKPVAEAGGPAVLIDPDPGAAWAGGTRVRITGGCITACSKDLEESAIDCGAFLVTPTIFDYYARAATRGDFSLAALLTGFACDHPLKSETLPPGAWWHDIDTPEDLSQAGELLRHSLVKPSDGPISRVLNRPLSTRVSMALAELRPSPMVLTVLTAAVGMIAALLLGAGLGITGGILAQLTSVLDGVDGEIARLQFKESPRGHFVDGLLDRLVDTALIAGLGVWAASQGAPAALLVVLVAAATAAVILSMATKDRVQLMGLRPDRDTFGSHLLGGRDGRLLIVALGSISGFPLATIAAIALTSGGGLISRLVYVLRSPEARG
jgi:1L-myo-inositol 1-phosphate cytidylyltransferase / CDP-L-myo-inositol myo-inositolphosphotransferase